MLHVPQEKSGLRDVFQVPQEKFGLMNMFHAPQEKLGLRDMLHVPQEKLGLRDMIHVPQAKFYLESTFFGSTPKIYGTMKNTELYLQILSLRPFTNINIKYIRVQLAAGI